MQWSGSCYRVAVLICLCFQRSWVEIDSLWRKTVSAYFQKSFDLFYFKSCSNFVAWGRILYHLDWRRLTAPSTASPISSEYLCFFLFWFKRIGTGGRRRSALLDKCLVLLSIRNECKNWYLIGFGLWLSWMLLALYYLKKHRWVLIEGRFLAILPSALNKRLQRISWKSVLANEEEGLLRH